MQIKHPRIFSDDVCIYVFANTNHALWRKAILILASLFMFSVVCFSLAIWLPDLTILSLIIGFMVLRYSLWNIYGEENLIINTKSLSYQHGYGFFRTGYKIK